MKQYYEYAEKLDLTRLGLEEKMLIERREGLKDVVPVSVRHIEIIEEQIEEVKEKLKIVRQFVYVKKILTGAGLVLTPKTLASFGEDMFFCQATDMDYIRRFVIVTQRAVCLSLEQARALRFYFATHEDDF